MILDKYSNPVFNEQDIFNILYQNKPIENLIVIDSPEISQLEEIADIKLTRYDCSDLSIEEFDKLKQSEWFMPQEYKELNIKEWVINQCNNETEILRIQEELEEFQNRNLLDLLRWLKYFVDICRINRVLWGVGRGSSTSSYVLYKIGVHKIDCLKYELEYSDFLRKGE